MTTILLSQHTRDTWGPTIEAAAAPAPVSLVTFQPGARPDPAALDAIEIAFLSTEMMGLHAKDVVNETLQTFFDTLRAAPALGWLHVCSAGTDRPFFAELAGRGVMVTNSSGANATTVAHTALAGMLALARGIPHWIDAQRERRWHPLRQELSPEDVEGSTAVVVGLGAIGTRIAALCQAFGMRVIGVRRQPGPTAGCNEVRPVQALTETLAEADWLILACPLTPDTRNLVNAELLARLPTSSYLINVSRGEVVNESDLLAALTQGRLAGAYSDVFVNEPLPSDSPLWNVPNLLISAHSAGASTGFEGRVVEHFTRNLERWLRGEALINQASFPAVPRAVLL